MNWLYYLLEANLYLAIFYAAYLLLLRNETYYNTNRWYILLTTILAFALPLVQIGWLKPDDSVIRVVVLTNNLALAPAGVNNNPAPAPLQWTDVLPIVYILGISIMAVSFVIKLGKLYRLIGCSHQVVFDTYKLVEVDDDHTGFSFFSYLFIGKNPAGRHTIITHELVHIRQKHSADIIFWELIKIINWFNPMIYMIQNSLKTIHEYIADEHTATVDTDSISYSSFLLNNAYGLHGPATTNSFFSYNLLKKRIIMLNKPRSGSAARLKYLVTVPAMAGMLCLSTLAFTKNYGVFELTGNNAAAPLPNAPQVTDTAKKQKLRVSNSGNTIIVDKFSVKKEDGSKKEYTVNNLTKNDVIYLKQKKQLTVGVVNVDAGTPPQPTKIILKAATVNTTNVDTTPPKKEFRLKLNTPNAEMGPVKRDTPTLRLSPPQPDRVSYILRITDDNLKAFNQHLERNIHYPAVDRQNNISGRVFARVITDEENKVKDVEILRAPSKTLENEAVRVIRSYKGKLTVAKGEAEYTIPIAFCIADKDGNIVLDKSKPGAPNSTTMPKTSSAKSTPSGKTHHSLNEVVIIAYPVQN